MSIHIGSFLTGEIRVYAGTTAPAGWLLCYGQTLNASTSPIYQDLFDVIGNTYGGTNNTNFVVPDLRGRAPVGKENMGGVSANVLANTAKTGIVGTTLGSKGGVDAYQLTPNETATTAHGHTSNPHHHRPFNYANSQEFSFSPVANNVYVAAYGSGTTVDNALDTKDTTVTINNATAANASQVHTNLQPSIILNCIIKI